MKMITAIVRTTALEHIVRSLEHMGVRSMTISEIKGIGEEVPLFKPYTIHDRIELVIPDEKADGVVRSILEHAATGLPGDGIVAVAPLEYAVKIRTGEKL